MKKNWKGPALIEIIKQETYVSKQKLQQNGENISKMTAIIFFGFNDIENFYQQFNNSIWDARTITLNVTLV